MRVLNFLPLSVSQIFRVLSAEAEIAVFPSGAIATARTESLWPIIVLSFLPLSVSQIFRVLSFEAEIAVFPSGAIATAYT